MNAALREGRFWRKNRHLEVKAEATRKRQEEKKAGEKRRGKKEEGRRGEKEEEWENLN